MGTQLLVYNNRSTILLKPLKFATLYQFAEKSSFFLICAQFRKAEN